MSTETMTHEQAYRAALEFCDPLAVEQAFCAADSWQEAYEYLGLSTDPDNPGY